MKVLCHAQSFGYGPIASLLRLLSRLRPVEHHLTYFGDAFTASLARRWPFDEYVLTAEAGDDFLQSLLGYGRFDAVITACGFDLANFAGRLGIRTVAYDMLYWFWDRPQVVANPRVLYLAQRFIGVEERASRDASVRVVGPLVTPPHPQPARSWPPERLGVSVCGFGNPFFGEPEEAAFSALIASALSSVKHRFPLIDIAVAGGERVAQALASRLDRSVARVTQMSPDEVDSWLSSIDAIAACPGLGSIFETFSQALPVHFLPPTNVTQARQVELLRRQGLSVHSSDWPPSRHIGASLTASEEARLMRQFSAAILADARSSNQGAWLADSLSEFLAMPRVTRDRAVDKGVDFFQAMGGDGSTEIASLIEQHLGWSPGGASSRKASGAPAQS